MVFSFGSFIMAEGFSSLGIGLTFAFGLEANLEEEGMESLECKGSVIGLLPLSPTF